MYRGVPRVSAKIRKVAIPVVVLKSFHGAGHGWFFYSFDGGANAQGRSFY
jgi:hypothetical protein